MISCNFKQISIEELKKNNGRNGYPLWININNKIYDVTGYNHPGGIEYFIDPNNWEDKYEGFLDASHSPVAQKIMQKKFIGVLKEK